MESSKGSSKGSTKYSTMKNVGTKILDRLRNTEVGYEIDLKISHINTKNIEYLKDLTWMGILVPIRNNTQTLSIKELIK